MIEWEKICRLAAEEYLEWHKAMYYDPDWKNIGVYSYRVREIMQDRAISAFRFDEIVAIIQAELANARAVRKIAERLRS